MALPELSGSEYEEYKKQIKYGSYDYYLYHHKDNTNVIGWCIVLTPFVFFFGGKTLMTGFSWVIFIWIVGWLICKANDYLLNQDPDTIYSRRVVFQHYLDVKHGYVKPVEFKKELL